MAELVVLNFKTAEGRFDALADWFKAVLGDTRAYDVCMKVEVTAAQVELCRAFLEGRGDANDIGIQVGAIASAREAPAVCF